MTGKSEWHVDVWRRDYEGGAIGQVYDLPDSIEASVFPGMSRPPDFTHPAKTVQQAKRLCDAWMPPEAGRRGGWFAFSATKVYATGHTMRVAAYGGPGVWTWGILQNGVILCQDYPSFAKARRGAEKVAQDAGWTDER